MADANGSLQRWMKSFLDAWLQTKDLLVLARVPLLVVLIGAVLAIKVGQVRELFVIAAIETDGVIWAVSAWFMVGALGLAAWYSTRTLYRFRWRNDPGARSIQKWLAEWLPRTLALLLPASIAFTYWQLDDALPAGSRWLQVLAYLALGAGLLLFTTYRRRMLRLRPVHAVVRPVARRLTGDDNVIEEEPDLCLLEGWSELHYARFIQLAAIGILLIAMIVGSTWPNIIEFFGPLALVFGFAAMLTLASTAPVYYFARRRLPLITGLVVLAFLLTALDLNDNHRARLAPGHESHQAPPDGLVYEGGRVPFDEFAGAWLEQRKEICGNGVFMISAAGGGIRAALWTAMVLAELDQRTNGKLWECTLAVSGVSGGSLGLASFAAYKTDTYNKRNNRSGPGDRLRAGGGHPLLHMLRNDFLSPVLGSMFGLDLAQRFIPWPVFIDRGQALEEAWVRAYDAINPAPDEPPGSLGRPLATTWCADAECTRADLRDSRLFPALFLNTTIVDSGKRLLQHPFAPFPDIGRMFPGAVDGADWFPKELPMSSATLNSARFTLISPAGTVQRKRVDGLWPDRVETLGQVVDGGYFENSGATTVAALVDWIRSRNSGVAENERITVHTIHISNGESVPGFMARREGAGDAPDQCPHACRVVEQQARLRGEALAPLAGILNTRDARAAYARAELLNAVGPHAGRLWHYRLCPGPHPIALGWTIGERSTMEMRRQLENFDPDKGAQLKNITREIVAALSSA